MSPAYNGLPSYRHLQTQTEYASGHASPNAPHPDVQAEHRIRGIHHRRRREVFHPTHQQPRLWHTNHQYCSSKQPIQFDALVFRCDPAFCQNHQDPHSYPSKHVQHHQLEQASLSTEQSYLVFLLHLLSAHQKKNG